MIKEKFFPTFIYAKDINLNTTHLSQIIFEWSQKDKGVQKTNVNGWHSTSDMQTKQEYQQLCKELYDMQVDIYKEEFIDRQPVLGNMWANINPPGAYNKLHCHPNSLFSSVYYVKSEPNSGRLKIHEPRPGKQLILPSLKKEKLPQDLWDSVYLEPVVGRVVMFPSWLWHEVEPNKSNDLRISISFNFIQHGFQ